MEFKINQSPHKHTHKLYLQHNVHEKLKNHHDYLVINNFFQNSKMFYLFLNQTINQILDEDSDFGAPLYILRHK